MSQRKIIPTMAKGGGPLAAGIGAILIVLVVADLFVDHHPAFGIDGTPAFAAWFGLLAAAAAIGVAYGFAALACRTETPAEQEGRDE